MASAMKLLSWDAAWQDVVLMARAGGANVLVIAGVFYLLPTLAIELWLPLPQLKSLDWDGIRQLNDFLVENAPLLLVTTLAGWFGTAAIYRLLLDNRRPTVGEALKAATALFISVVLLNWLTGFALLLGLFAFIIPGIYLLGRTAVAVPALMAENIPNPIAAFNRSLELTRGNGWRTVGLILIVVVVAEIASSAVQFVVGILVGAVTSGEVERGLIALLAAGLTTLQGLLFVVLSTAIYRQLADFHPSARPRPAAGS